MLELWPANANHIRQVDDHKKQKLLQPRTMLWDFFFQIFFTTSVSDSVSVCV